MKNVKVFSSVHRCCFLYVFCFLVWFCDEIVPAIATVPSIGALREGASDIDMFVMCGTKEQKVRYKKFFLADLLDDVINDW